MLNNCTFIGRWSKDLEIVQANNGTDILNTSLAVSDPYDKDNPLFIDVKAFKQKALNAHQFTKKGSKVAVSGKLKLEKWTKDGQNRSKHVLYAMDIVFLDEKGDNNRDNGTENKWEQSKPAYEPNKDKDPFADKGGPIDISDEDLPF